MTLRTQFNPNAAYYGLFHHEIPVERLSDNVILRSEPKNPERVSTRIDEILRFAQNDSSRHSVGCRTTSKSPSTKGDLQAPAFMVNAIGLSFCKGEVL
jgi:hypothetical protein